MISKRIKELALFIPKTIRVVDIGCDHALLDIYLALKNPETRFLATDISANAIKGAIKNINAYKLNSRIDTLVTDGLNGISLTKDDIIVISGMGTNTIKEILEPRLNEIEKCVIQTNRDIEALREFMFQNGFVINDEKIVYDKMYYIFISFERGSFNYSDIDIWLGPIIKNSNDYSYFEHLLIKYQKIVSGIPDDDLKKIEIKKRIALLLSLIGKK